ncbi:MAG: hypothetical protein AAGF77_04840 [Bacteroidota bacterium]
MLLSRGYVLVLCSFLLLGPAVVAQRIIKKQLLQPGTEFIHIHGKHCYQIELNTHQEDQVLVAASMEGEYAKDLVVNLDTSAKTLNISISFLPSFSLPNDKLSAHKVISIALHITIPEFLSTAVYGTNTHVFAKGDYNHLSIQLADGHCTLDQISGIVAAKTQLGQIAVTGAKGSVTLKSDYGKTYKGAIPKGNDTYVLHAVEGDIMVNQKNNQPKAP